MPWADLHDVEPDERRLWTGRSAWTLAIVTASGRLGLLARPALGSPMGASASESDVLVLRARALRHTAEAGQRPRG